MKGLILPISLGDETLRLVTEGCLRGYANAIASYDESRISGNRGYSVGVRRVRMVVWHITEGGLTGTLDWLCSPGSGASANDVIARDGTVYNLVPGDEAPWTNGKLCNPNEGFHIIKQAIDRGVNPNLWSYTIENVGFTTHGRSGALTEAQIAVLILRTAQACVGYRLSADLQHIIRHSDIDSCTRANCPGFSGAEIVRWVQAVKAVSTAWRGW